MAPPPLCQTVNVKILLDTHVRQSISKYFWTSACDGQLENTPGHQPAFPIGTLEQDKRV